MKNSQKHTVLYIDNTYTVGGAINSLLYLLRAIDKSKFEPILVTGQPELFLRENFNFLTWEKIDFKLPWVHNKAYKKILQIRLFSISFFRRALNCSRFIYWFFFIILPESMRYYRFGKKHNADLVHLNNIFGSQLAAIIASKLLRVPCVAHLRCFEQVDWLTRLYAKFVDHHIAISTAIKENLIDLNIHDSKISIIYDAIDLDTFNNTVNISYLENEFGIHKGTFGIFGRVISWKGIKAFVNAAAIVFKEHPDACAFIVGDQSDSELDYLADVIALIDQYGIADRIKLTGYRQDVPALMKFMDIIVHSSIVAEPFGMVLIEGMAMGKPIVATKLGGPLDIVLDGETGILVDPDDVNSMAKAINFLLHNTSKAEEMGRRGRERVEMLFAKEAYASQVVTVYQQLIN